MKEKSKSMYFCTWGIVSPCMIPFSASVSTEIASMIDWIFSANLLTSLLLFNLWTDFANALCDPIAYHQEEKRQEQLKSLLDDEDEEVGFSSCRKA